MVLAWLVGKPVLRLRGHYLAMATLGLGVSRELRDGGEDLNQTAKQLEDVHDRAHTGKFLDNTTYVIEQLHSIAVAMPVSAWRLPACRSGS